MTSNAKTVMLHKIIQCVKGKQKSKLCVSFLALSNALDFRYSWKLYIRMLYSLDIMYVINLQ